MKPRLTVDQQIDKMKSKEIQFEIVKEEDARSFLNENTYYFKIKSYGHNYAAENGRYKDLDFAYLLELSKIDYSLSRFISSLCFRVEHSMKVQFNRMVMDNGYEFADTCAETFKLHCRNRSHSLRTHTNPYIQGLMDSHNDKELALWHLWEILSFADQLELYKQYHDCLNQPCDSYPTLFKVVKLRNAVAHGNCLLADVNRRIPSKTRHDRTDTEITNAVMELMGIKPVYRKGKDSKPSIQVQLDKLIVNNFAALLLMAMRFVQSEGQLRHTLEELESLNTRMDKYREIYWGKFKRREDRNPSVNSTLKALMELSRTFIKQIKQKIPDN